MESVASQLIEEVTAHAQSDSLEDAREICADGTYFPNNLRMSYKKHDIHTAGTYKTWLHSILHFSTWYKNLKEEGTGKAKCKVQSHRKAGLTL